MWHRTRPRYARSSPRMFPPTAGAKFAQELHYGSDEHTAVYATLRNTIEGLNGVAKDGAYEALGDATRRRIGGSPPRPSSSRSSFRDQPPQDRQVPGSRGSRRRRRCAASEGKSTPRDGSPLRLPSGERPLRRPANDCRHRAHHRKLSRHRRAHGRTVIPSLADSASICTPRSTVGPHVWASRGPEHLRPCLPG